MTNFEKFCELSDHLLTLKRTELIEWAKENDIKGYSQYNRYDMAWYLAEQKYPESA